MCLRICEVKSDEGGLNVCVQVPRLAQMGVCAKILALHGRSPRPACAPLGVGFLKSQWIRVPPSSIRRQGGVLFVGVQSSEIVGVLRALRGAASSPRSFSQNWRSDLMTLQPGDNR